MSQKINRERLTTIAKDVGIPAHMITGLVEYIMKGRPVGHFLTALLSNDLRETCARADEENLPKLPTYVFFLHNYAPIGCWGSPEHVAKWREIGGLEGLLAEAEADKPKPNTP